MNANIAFQATVSYAFMLGLATAGLIFCAMGLYSGAGNWMSTTFSLLGVLVTGWLAFINYKDVSDLLKSAPGPKA